MSIRDQRQAEFARMYINSNRFCIMHLCPRFGKTRVAINILKELKPSNILICYPDEKIKASWKADFETLQFGEDNVTFTTYLSLGKLVSNQYDIVICDEIHLLSSNQTENLRQLILRGNHTILGLSGTISKDTEKNLLYDLKLPILASYSIEQAIREGVIVNYHITVIRVPLDRQMRLYKGKTEKQKFDGYTHVINKMVNEGKETFFLRLSRMRLIQNSYAKKIKTIQLLKKFESKRVLVFCGVTKMADSLGIPSFHSKSKDKDIFEKFIKGEGNHLAVVKMGNTGTTFLPLNCVIINYADSNPENLCQKILRSMNFEYDNLEKKAFIYIVSTDEKTELDWIKKALAMFSPEKIKYL